MERVRTGDMFGSVLDINAIGAGVLPPDTMIPGVAVASARATPLAGEACPTYTNVADKSKCLAYSGKGRRF